ncbi:Hypothetical protein SMAX5B_004687 [Scophthalmus maximus]|uniref:Uncharacterized protein n=1 Tax=Scophthalmus maximus TaxID=52904 RepID=A0A2U9CV37_SCOMX|nr:Hypothetical protein SMAX5B_004687 [Scophthalmus maximus]
MKVRAGARQLRDMDVTCFRSHVEFHSSSGQEGCICSIDLEICSRSHTAEHAHGTTLPWHNTPITQTGAKSLATPAGKLTFASSGASPRTLGKAPSFK